ncbi:MAG TPA: adenylate/guanylate cyclase domain-containing protein [Candidatus Limnocylindrales bacterium]|nr:adenylate/guanylate cyclase domain-containing protein [Candidatus Limnocylindrales bacterium]
MGPDPKVVESENEELWRGLLDGTNPVYARTRALMKRIPGSPRCKMCAAPFGSPGRWLIRFQGRRRWEKNPDYCNLCFDVLSRYHGGAELEASFLFADVRGSTTMAETMRPAEFRRLLDGFYDLAARLIVEHDGIVDKFVGDEAIGIFIPATARTGHARAAVDAARALAAALGAGTRSPSPSGGRVALPIGIGVGTGVAFVGSVGEPPVTSLTALGDIVNVTARLASTAAAGEILVNERAAQMSGLTAGLESRSLDLKGKSGPTVVYVIPAAEPG